MYASDIYIKQKDGIVSFLICCQAIGIIYREFKLAIVVLESVDFKDLKLFYSFGNNPVKILEFREHPDLDNIFIKFENNSILRTNITFYEKLTEELTFYEYKSNKSSYYQRTIVRLFNESETIRNVTID